MKRGVAAALMLYLTLSGVVHAIDSAYQWTDKQGQIHYGDKPSTSTNSRTITLQGRIKQLYSPSGLRPGELDQLYKLEQRRRQQRHRAQTVENRSDRQRAVKRARCAENRSMFKNSSGNESFKKYSRYLRNNCW